MRALSAYARPRQLLLQGITEGVKPFAKSDGHKPWTPEQLRAAHDKLTGVVRRGIMLYLYTGQRGSDIVRIGFADIDDGGFSVRQRKTGREVWCPIVPELAEEIATWEKRPGPFLLQASGKPYSRQHRRPIRLANPMAPRGLLLNPSSRRELAATAAPRCRDMPRQTRRRVAERAFASRPGGVAASLQNVRVRLPGVCGAIGATTVADTNTSPSGQ